MNVIGITGSSGSGKSAVCDIFLKKYNVKIINADEISKELSQNNIMYINEIGKCFGDHIIDKDGKIKRTKLAEIIYTSEEAREKLNKCTFKYIVENIEKEIKNSGDASTIIIDAPLLFEAELENICDYVIGVISKKEVQIQRIVNRDNISYEHAKNRINAQKSNEFYKANCDEIIQNDRDFLEIENIIDKIAKKYNITKKLQ